MMTRNIWKRYYDVLSVYAEINRNPKIFRSINYIMLKTNTSRPNLQKLLTELKKIKMMENNTVLDKGYEFLKIYKQLEETLEK